MPTEIVEDNSKENLAVNSKDNIAENVVENSILGANDKSKSTSSCTSVSGAGFLITDNDSETISIKCYDRLIEELKCPGCAVPMRSPIRLCAQGHSICDKCTKILEKCPLCKESFTLIRSLTVEALSAKAQFCCSYSMAGCKVRLPLELLDWHQNQCQLKIIKCFMGRVWGGCDWMGRESMWPDHLESKHMDKIYNQFPVELEWNISGRLTSFAGYFVLNWEDQSFNLYQIFDRENSRILWSMTIAGKLTKKHRDYIFAYEIEIYSREDETKVICQRFPCHKEQDKDILQEGTCVAIPMADITRFLVEPEKIINYRVKIHKVKTPTKRNPLLDKQLPVDFKQTNIEGGNHKSVSPDIIVTRKLEDESSSSLIVSPSESSSPSKEKESDHSGTAYGNLNSDSDSDPELEAFVNDMIKKKWTKNLTTPNLNRKFWDDNYSYNESESVATLNNMTETNTKYRNSLERYEDQDFLGRLKKKNSIKSFRDAFKNFRISSNKKKNEDDENNM